MVSKEIHISQKRIYNNDNYTYDVTEEIAILYSIHALGWLSDNYKLPVDSICLEDGNVVYVTLINSPDEVVDTDVNTLKSISDIEFKYNRYNIKRFDIYNDGAKVISVSSLSNLSDSFLDMKFDHITIEETHVQIYL